MVDHFSTAVWALFAIIIVVKGLGSGLKKPRFEFLAQGVSMRFELSLNLKKYIFSFDSRSGYKSGN